MVDGPEEYREDASHPADDGRQAETPEEEEIPAKKVNRRETWTTQEKTSVRVGLERGTAAGGGGGAALLLAIYYKF